MTLALYRKYRPQSFAEVIGQEHVTEPLISAIGNGRLNHAYLFSGPRGCGKTSSARILARSLNCAKGPTPTPCGECDSCVALSAGGGGSIDVIEIDAASHGGVDDARELRERAVFAPVNSRYKIYVIDEAHMVSSAGFNALLKLVEEPPDYVMFVFATTEPEKVLPTIRSRTHHYPFRLIPPAAMRGLCEKLCQEEGITVEDAVYPLVIRAGAGSARDTLSVLDQLIAGAGDEGVTYARAVALLGVTDGSLLDGICEALSAMDGAGAIGVIDKALEAGHDPRRFASDLLERLRDLIVLNQVPDAGSTGLIDVPSEVLERMTGQAIRMGTPTLTRMAEIFHGALSAMRGTTAPRLLLELACARAVLPSVDDSAAGLLQRIYQLERRIADGVPMAAPAHAAPAPTPPPPSGLSGREAAKAAAAGAAAQTAGHGSAGPGRAAGASRGMEGGAGADGAATAAGPADAHGGMGGAATGGHGSAANGAVAGTSSGPGGAAAAAQTAGDHGASAAPTADGVGSATAASQAAHDSSANGGRADATAAAQGHGPAAAEDGSHAAAVSSAAGRGDVSASGAGGGSAAAQAAEVGDAGVAAPQAESGPADGAPSDPAPGGSGSRPNAAAAAASWGDEPSQSAPASGHAAGQGASGSRPSAATAAASWGDEPAAPSGGHQAARSAQAASPSGAGEATPTGQPGGGPSAAAAGQGASGSRPSAATAPAADHGQAASQSGSGGHSAAPAPGGDRLAQVRASWEQVKQAVKDRKKTVAAFLMEATVTGVDGDTLVLTFRHAFHANALTGDAALPIFTSALSSVLGGTWRVRCEIGEAGAPPPPPPPRPAPQRAAPPPPAAGPVGPGAIEEEPLPPEPEPEEYGAPPAAASNGSVTMEQAVEMFAKKVGAKKL